MIVNGQVNNVTEAVHGITGEVLEDNEYLAYFWLTNGGICALCGTDTMYTFIAVPIVSGIVTITASTLDVWVRGEAAARKPLIFCKSTAERRVEQLEDYIKEHDLELPPPPGHASDQLTLRVSPSAVEPTVTSYSNGNGKIAAAGKRNKV